MSEGGSLFSLCGRLGLDQRFAVLLGNACSSFHPFGFRGRSGWQVMKILLLTEPTALTPLRNARKTSSVTKNSIYSATVGIWGWIRGYLIFLENEHLFREGRLTRHTIFSVWLLFHPSSPVKHTGNMFAVEYWSLFSSCATLGLDQQMVVLVKVESFWGCPGLTKNYIFKKNRLFIAENPRKGSRNV